VKDKVLAWCREQALFSPGERVVCAFSGGADSTAMLCCLASLRGEMKISLSAAHFNHGLRGAESDRDEAFCRDFCRERSIPFTAGRGNVAARARETGESTEQAARELRYEFLLSLSGDKVATAHTADDNLETILMNFTRGTGLRGLSGIPPVRGRLARPLLCVSRAEIEAYLVEAGVSHVEDSTNADDGCLRNRLRHHVVPLLRAENPSLTADTALLAARLRADEDCLTAQAAELLAASSEGNGSWRVAPLLAAPEPVLARCAAQVLTLAGLTRPTAGHVRSILAVLRSESPSARCALPDGAEFCRRYGTALLVREKRAATWAPVVLPLSGSTVLPAAGLRVFCEGPLPAGAPGTPEHFSLRADRMTGGILLRPRHPGDVMRLPGGAKRLSRLQIDRKIPAAMRDLLPVLEVNGEIAAAAGIGGDTRFLARPGETAYLISIRKERGEEFHD